jgi:phage repressor protein C with HTH and peptisase S24 domain
MAPFLHAGDYVAGHYTTNFCSISGQPCLIETCGGQFFIRILSKSNGKRYGLSTTNPQNLNTLFLFQDEIKRIAKIFWIRKKIN